VSQADLSGADLRGADVRREWKGIDVLVVFRSPPFVVVIENKIDSDEHSDQLRRYRDTVTRHYPHSRVLCVYLTPDGDDPSDASWLVYTYGHVFRLLERLRRDHAGAFGGDLKVVLDHYLQLLGTRFMHDPRIDDLCRTVYKKHRQALDLIWERVRGLATGLMADVAYAAREDAWWDVVHENDKVVNLVPKAWYDWLPGIGELYDDPRVWVVLKIQAFDGRLGWFVELQGILEHKGRRKRIGETLVAAAPGLGFEPTTGRKPTANFAKVTGVETVLEWGRAEQPDPETIRTAVRKLLEEVRPKFDSLEAVLKPLRT
jgi:hypothetical protein